MADPRFWHPRKKEWQAACLYHDDWDPDNTLMFKSGKAMAIFIEDAPLDEVKEGLETLEREKEEAQRKQREELARTKEEAEQESIRRAMTLERLRRQEVKNRERARANAPKQAAKKKAVTEDDPFQASVANAVDKDRYASNANYIIHTRRISDLPKIALSDAQEVRERVDWYYQLCATDGVRPNLPGLALAFGLTRTGLMNAIVDRRMPRDAAQELGRGIAMIDGIVSAMALDNKIQPVAAIYLMNNWLGYKNASEVTTRNETVETNVDQKALEKKYQSVLDMD